MRFRIIVAAGVLLAASFFAASGEWPWRRLASLPAAAEKADVTDKADRSALSDLSAISADTLRRGETLSTLFARNGLGETEVRSVASLIDLRRLRAGLVFTFRRHASDSLPAAVEVRTGSEHRLRLDRLSGTWDARLEPVRWYSDTVRIAGTIERSLYDALDASIPWSTLGAGERVRLAWDVADVFQWQVDFSRDLPPGDDFRVLLERLRSEDGEVRAGRILAADMTVNGSPLTAYRFSPASGPSGFFDLEGRSLRRANLKAPVEYRRISSRFARSRMHPLLGYARRHEGTDYAADPGTPVMAAGDGSILRSGWTGGYGNMVEVRHRNGIITRYGHLRGFASGIRAGARVTQGQVLGYVGSTGLASGPHLHYEFRINGVARDPMSVDLGSGEPIAPGLKPAFDTERERLRFLLEGLTALGPVRPAEGG